MDNKNISIRWGYMVIGVIAMLFAGCTNLLVYIFNKKEIHGSRWLLADGLTTALLSVFPLFNKIFHYFKVFAFITHPNGSQPRINVSGERSPRIRRNPLRLHFLPELF